MVEVRTAFGRRVSAGVLALVCATAVVSGCGAGGGRGIPAGPDLRWHDSQPVWSPDGRQIAFVRGRKWFSVHVLTVRTGKVRRVTPPRTKVWESQPAWSPDSRSIVFVHNETSVDIDDDELYRINVDARRLVRLTHNKLTDRFPVWLRDGSIAFWRYPYNRLIDRGRREHALAGPGYTSWSPDGSRMAIGSYKGGLAIVRRRGRAPQKIVGRGVADVAWSPDGSRIAFVSTSGISVVHPDGTGRRLVTDGGASDYEVVMDPVWSPDGSLIAFVLVNSSVPDWVHGLYIVRAAGGGLRRLKIPIREQAVSYAWSPDSRHLVIGGNQVDLSRAFPASPYPLILVDVQSSEMKRLTQTGKS